MTCEDARQLLHPYVDGELDLVRSLEVEAHLGDCAACRLEQAAIGALRTALHEGGLYHQAPTRLERRVRAAVSGQRWSDSGRRFTRYAGGVAAVAAVFVIAFVVGGIPRFRAHSDDLTAREVVDDHLRSLTANHLTDVLSSNQHTVKPWFDGRLDFAPPVVDLGAQGFPLIGGRLDYLDNRPVAAVVYRRRQHIINLFISPAEGSGDTMPVGETRAGYNLVHWFQRGMSYWVVSSLGGVELGQFARLLLANNAPVPTPPKSRG
ncbi:MAG TPA: anti-sigma factor [Candidatus Binataceae bacterium]|nr:anti-sigma factor [Candidatus Binataceae bacterium]